MEESEASIHMSEDAFFQQCCRGFEYAEDVLESFVKKAVEKIHTDLKDSLKIVIGCIRDTEKDMIRNKGLISTILEHQCKKMPACNELVKLLVSKLPFAFQANRAKLFRVMLQNGLWEFAKLFLEPWMWSLCGFEKLDAFCLLVLIDNTSTFNHESLPWTSRHMHTRRTLYQNRVRKIRLIAEACFCTDNEALKKEERDACLHAIIDMLSFVSTDKDADVAIENILKIKDNPGLEMEGRLQQKRLELKQVMKLFERKVSGTFFFSDMGS